MKIGKTKEAASDCSRAIDLDEKYTKAYLRRANCYMTLGQYEEAVRDYEKVSQNFPRKFRIIFFF